MIKFGKGVVKYRIMILILAFALLVPAGISFINTRINFDILSYLPGEEYMNCTYLKCLA